MEFFETSIASSQCLWFSRFQVMKLEMAERTNRAEGKSNRAEGKESTVHWVEYQLLILPLSSLGQSFQAVPKIWWPTQQGARSPHNTFPRPHILTVFISLHHSQTRAKERNTRQLVSFLLSHSCSMSKHSSRPSAPCWSYHPRNQLVGRQLSCWWTPCFIYQHISIYMSKVSDIYYRERDVSYIYVSYIYIYGHLHPIR